MIQTLKGFRDFLPEEVKERQWLINRIRQTFELFGFEPLETPALEYQQLFEDKYGAEADKLIYKFTDEGGRDVALRFDQTVPTARVLAQNLLSPDLPDFKLLRRYQIQPVWRAEKPQKGRYREFLQCDADIFAAPPPLADAEILAAFYAIYQNIGFKTLIIKVNDRQILAKFLEDAGVDPSQILLVTQCLDKLEKIGQDGVLTELTEKGIGSSVIDQLFSSLKKEKENKTLATILEAAKRLGVPNGALVFDPALARGLDYYTGLIFEGFIPASKSGSVGGGGRYDHLLEKLTNAKVTGVGFGLGFDRTLEAAKQFNLLPMFPATAKVFVTIHPEHPDPSYSIKVTKILREAGVNTELFADNPVDAKTYPKLDKQLKYADRKGIPFVVILGPDEAEKELVTLKNMASGEQKTVPLEKLPELLQD